MARVCNCRHTEINLSCFSRFTCFFHPLFSHSFHITLRNEFSQSLSYLFFYFFECHDRPPEALVLPLVALRLQKCLHLSFFFLFRCSNLQLSLGQATLSSKCFVASNYNSMKCFRHLSQFFTFFMDEGLENKLKFYSNNGGSKYCNIQKQGLFRTAHIIKLIVV